MTSVVWVSSHPKHGFHWFFDQNDQPQLKYAPIGEAIPRVMKNTGPTRAAIFWRFDQLVRGAW